MKINNIHNEIKTDLFDVNNKNCVNSEQLFEKLYDLRNAMFEAIEINKLSKYFAFKVYNNILSCNLCDLIINESEKFTLQNNGWTINRHKNYPTIDFPVRFINSISTIVHNIIAFEVFPRIEELYNINKYFLTLHDVFIVKYSHDTQNNLELHQDECLFSFNFALNDTFEGGGTIIMVDEKEVIIENSKGRLLIHSGRMLHGGKKVTKGIRYVLVGFVRYLPNFMKSYPITSITSTDTLKSNSILSSKEKNSFESKKEKCICVLGSVISINETEASIMKNRILDAAGSTVGLPLFN